MIRNELMHSLSNETDLYLNISITARKSLERIREGVSSKIGSNLERKDEYHNTEIRKSN